MKVKDFIEQLQSKYDLEDELYFTTCIYDCEVAFDTIEVEDKEDGETDVYLELSERNKKDFVDSLEDEVYRDFANEIEQTLYKYGFGGRY